jgi:hypothetical protein
MRATLACCFILPALLLCLAATAAPSPTAQNLGESILLSLSEARTALLAGQSPWAGQTPGPDPATLIALSEALPGNYMWPVFKRTEALVRSAYRAQRQGFTDKDAGLIYRRDARPLFDELARAVTWERPLLPAPVTALGTIQVAQAVNALERKEYHATLTLMWSLADLTGLWDRQAALEAGAAQLTWLKAVTARRTTLPEREAKVYEDRLSLLAALVERALLWEPDEVNLPETARFHVVSRQYFLLPQWTPYFLTGTGYDTWRHTVLKPGSSAYLREQPCARQAQIVPWAEMPPFDTRPVHPDPTSLRSWQVPFGESRYGWLVYTRHGGRTPTGSDWRALKPYCFWPAAKGAENAGGL